MSIIYTRLKMRGIYYFIWIFSLATLSWCLLFLMTGEQFTVIRWGSYIAPWLLGVTLVLFVIVLFYKKILLAGSILLSILLIGYPYIPLFIPSQIKTTVNQPVYKVMTYSKMGRNHDMDSVARTILKENPDILFIQEISAADIHILNNILSAHYNETLSVFIDNHVGLILSRFNIVAHTEDSSKTPSIIIETPEKNIRVWNVHLEKSFFSTDKQYESVENIATQVAHEKLPILVAGDFNATGINYPCKLLKQQLKDAFEESGFGFGFTFPSSARRLGLLTPFIRIDHIFFSNHFNSHSSYVVADNGGADHYPVVALLSFKN